jgi:preprotein translocase subunit YajC
MLIFPIFAKSKQKQMKRFSLKKAQNGNEVCTKSGLPVKILLFDRDSRIFPLVAIINNRKVYCYTTEGKFYADGRKSDFDLRMKE